MGPDPSYFAGTQSLLTVIGTVGFLPGQGEQNYSAPLLRMEWAQAAGRISYSWYWWHWPPLSLWFLATGAAASGGCAFALAGAGLGAGTISYIFLESRPERFRIRTRQGALATITIRAVRHRLHL